MKKEVFDLIDLVSDMKVAQKTGDFSTIAASIEKWQSIANKLEAALYDKNDLDRARKEGSNLRKENEKLEAEIKAQKKALQDQPFIIQETNKLKNTLKEMKKDLKNVYKIKESNSER
jgi:hypothetical protein